MWVALLTVVALATLPYVRLLAVNVGEVLDLQQVLVWWGITLAVSVTVVGVAAWRRPGVVGRVGAVVGVGLYLLFQYPMVTSMPRPAAVAAWAWWILVTGVVVGVTVVVARRTGIQHFVAVAGVGLLLLPVVELSTSAGRPAVADQPADGQSDTDAVRRFAHRPNVYWFILDGLAAPGYLADELGVEVDPFVQFLRDRDFGVIQDARANYPLTHVAVASALEMEYLHEGLDEPPKRPYFERLQGANATVDRFLAEGFGYVHAFPGLWSGSRCGGREVLCLGGHGSLTDTEWALAEATPFSELIAGEETAREVATVNDPARATEAVVTRVPHEPYFALIHLLNPHPPYLRDATCQLRDVSLSMSRWGEGEEYGDAVTCLFDRLQVAVEQILAADDDPVIIIQGDHGPRLGLSADTTGIVRLEGDMFLSAFNAIRLPASCEDHHVPDDMTMVNTFRLVFACLEDRPADLRSIPAHRSRLRLLSDSPSSPPALRGRRTIAAREGRHRAGRPGGPPRGVPDHDPRTRRRAGAADRSPGRPGGSRRTSRPRAWRSGDRQDGTDPALHGRGQR